MNNHFDCLVIGGGVLGTFHAYHAMKRGLKVALIEKGRRPQGATVRNFGQVVPSGMDRKWQQYGRESLRIYSELQTQIDLTIRNEGTIYFASDEEEETLLVELSEINKQENYASRILSRQECLKQYPGLKSDYVRAGLYFPEELIIEPEVMINRLQDYLAEKGVDIHFGTLALSCDVNGGKVEVACAGNKNFTANKVIICNGSDLDTLFPEIFAQSDLEVVKLQMMQTVPQQNFNIKGAVLSGLSVRRYESFRECPSYQLIKEKEDVDSQVKKWGVHILFKQTLDGSVIIGDSHHYASPTKQDELGFDLDMDIDEFIMKEARRIYELPDDRIKYRWYGVYVQCRQKDIFQKTIDQHIHIVTGIGGKGMTGSAGFSKAHIDHILN
jgi:FAD dependent oxidoreductase TIGR03364